MPFPSSKRFVVVDFETRSKVNLRTAGAWRYAADPSTEILCAGFAVDEEPVQMWKPGDDTLLQHLNGALQDRPIVSFGMFERPLWQHKFGIVCPSLESWIDLQSVCAALSLPLNLDGAAQMVLHAQKDGAGKDIIKKLARIDRGTGEYKYQEEIPSALYDYCAKDVELERQLYLRLGSLAPCDHADWLVMQRLNERGIPFDLNALQKLRHVVPEEITWWQTQFQEMTGLADASPRQRAKVLAALEEPLADLRRATVSAALPTASKVDQGILQTRQMTTLSSLAKLDRIYQAQDHGIVRGCFQFHGTGPGRSSGRLLQPQNFPKPTVEYDQDEAFMLLENFQTQRYPRTHRLQIFSAMLRGLIKAPAGCLLFAGDYSAIQARITLAIAGQTDKVALLHAGKDVYCDMATSIFGRPITKRDVAERQLGKAAVLGLGFQMGSKRFAQTLPASQGVEFAERVVKTYREEWAPKVRQFWYDAENAAYSAVLQRQPADCRGVRFMYGRHRGSGLPMLQITVPSGRKMSYPYPEIGEDGRLTYQHMRGFRLQLFGGVLTENIVMGIEHDLLMHAMTACEAAGFMPIMDNHDEVVAIGSANAELEVFSQAMSAVPRWAQDYGIPVAVECWKGKRYHK